MSQITIRVTGHPPAKSEALSVLGASHPHTERVVRLLEAARAALDNEPGSHLEGAPIRMEVVVALPPGRRSDATNYLGGIADVLQHKGPRGPLPHLGELADVDLFWDDRQVEDIRFRFEPAGEPSYVVRLEAITEPGTSDDPQLP